MLVRQCLVRAGEDGDIPAWNEFVREAREAFLEWRASGGPRWGPLAERMRSIRSMLKFCLRWCKLHEQQLRAQSLAAKLASGDSFDFWCEVRAMSPGSHTLHLRVDQVVGEVDVATTWGDHYKGILNCVSDHVNENALRGEMSNVTLQGSRSVDHGELRGVLWSLSNNEALGVDGLPSEAFKYAPSSLIT